MKEWFTAAELAAKTLPGLPASKRGIAKLAARSGWAATPGATRTRTDGAVEFSVSLLPEHARHALAGHALAAPVASPAGPATIERDARLAILTMQQSFASLARLTPRMSDAAFAAAYNSGHVSADDWVRDAFPKISERSLRKWRKWRGENSERLSNGRGDHKTKPSILKIANEGEVANLIAGSLVRQPHLNARHLRGIVLAAYGSQLEIMTDDGALLDVPVPQERAFRDYIANWKDENRMALAALTDPDAFKSRYRVSGFSRDHVERVNHVWETDASPADVLCIDGRYTIYALVDVFSRRMMTLVSRTPRADAVLVLVRKAILAWGVPEKVKTDNGSDFKAYAVRRAFSSLGIEHHLCDPFSPEQKGKVERAIGTMQRDLMPQLPGFIGHSVAHRKIIEARKSFASRLGQDDDKAFGVELTSSDLQSILDRWAADDYGRRVHSAIKMSPFEKAQSCRVPLRHVKDERALDLLLAPVPGSDGIRTVGKQGLKIDTVFFTAATLMPGEKVLVRHDPADAGRVFCFTADGSEFIAEAICYERAGINPAAAVAKARAEQNRVLNEGKAELRKQARQIKPRDMYATLQAAAEQKASTVVAFPQSSTTHTTPQLAAAGEAASPKKLTKATLTESQQRAIADVQQGWQPPERAKAHTVMAKVARVVDLPETPKHRFRRAFLIEQAIAKGGDVPIDDALWLGNYQRLPEYKGQKTLFNTFGEEWLFDSFKA